MMLLLAGLLAAQQPPVRPSGPQTAPPPGAVVQGAPRTLTVERDATGALSIDPHSFVQVMLPSDSPLEVVRVDYGSSRVTRRSNTLEMDLNLTVTVRNRSGKSVEGLALAMGGLNMNAMGLSAISGIRLESGGEFTLPATRAAVTWSPNRNGVLLGAPSSVQVRLDAVLFSDGSGYGPDLMRALSAMRMNQAESLRDRRFFQAMYQSGGLPQVLPALQRWANEAANPGAGQPAVRALGGAAAEQIRQQARPFDFRVTRFNGAPVEIVSARAGLSDGRLVDPAIEVRNVSGRDIADLHVTWIVRDGSGKEIRVATLAESGRPQAGFRFELPAGETMTLKYPSVMEVGSAPVSAGRVYLRAVQFSDGRVWVPERSALLAAGFPTGMTLSPEVIRLYRLYQSQGPPALLSEIRK